MKYATSTTANIVYVSIGFGVLCLVAFGFACLYKAGPEAFTCLSTIALAFGIGTGGAGSVAHGLRHAGSRAPTSAQLAAASPEPPLPPTEAP